MRTKFVIAAGLAALWAAGGVSGADTRTLVGATREEILARFGEPKSHIVAGNREVLIFANERVTLRDNRAVEIDDLPTEPSSPPAPPSAPAPAEATADTTTASTPSTHATPPAPGSANATADMSGNATITATPIPPPPPQVVIKSVRPPSRTVAPAPARATPPAPPAATESETSPKPVDAAPAVSANPVATPPAAVSAMPGGNATGNATAETATSVAPVPTSTSANVPAAPAATVTDTAAAVPATIDSTKPPGDATTAGAILKPTAGPVLAKPAVVAKGSSVAAPAEPASGSHRFMAIALGVIAAGIGYLYWRRRQRAALLAATAVSRSPFAPPTVAAGAIATNAAFTADLLAKLEWKRFEELVATYYNKTGVVATRTKSGPASPVHIRISWKGEQRPFACVQCHAHPPGLLDAKPVQSLIDALAAEDIRRGYVVTSGKFGVPARDLAEDKHITLLSGDLFVDKLNALPEPARAELLRDATAGDYTTPSCPTCETKMTRGLGESAWSCPQCGTTLPRG